MANGDPQFSQGEFQGRVIQSLANIEADLKRKVDREEFLPVKNIAYGLVGLVMTAVLGAMIASVVRALTS